MSGQWRVRQEDRLGRRLRSGGREVIGKKGTWEITTVPDMDGYYTVIAKGLSETNAKGIVQLESLARRAGEALESARHAVFDLNADRHELGEIDSTLFDLRAAGILDEGREG